MLDSHRYACSGEVSVIGDNEVEVTELPIRVWTQVYKESVMESLLHGSEKQAPLINDYKEYHTDTTVRFLVNVTENKLEKAEQEGLYTLSLILHDLDVFFNIEFLNRIEILLDPQWILDGTDIVVFHTQYLTNKYQHKYQMYHCGIHKILWDSHYIFHMIVFKGLHRLFKLQTTLTTTSMVLFDANGCLKKYESVEDILREFYDVRLRFYQKRKNYLEGVLQAESRKLSNQARFICEKCDGVLTVENKKVN